MNRQQIIKEYLSRFPSDYDFNINTIMDDLHKLLGEKPAVDMKYEKIPILNEVLNEAVEKKVLTEISITYSPDHNFLLETLVFKLNSPNEIEL